MQVKSNYINMLFLCILVFFSSCSTKKKTWVNRQYHNTTAKFNGYFNGSQSIKTGIKKLHSNYKDDYNIILPVFPTGDLKNAKNIEVLSISNLLGEALKRISNSTSVSDLFK